MAYNDFNIQRVSLTPTVTATNAYGTNYVVGGLLTFPSVFTGTGKIILQAVEMKCKKVETCGFTFTPFTANPSNTTWTDATVAGINAADVTSVASTIPLGYSSVLGTHTISYAYGLNLPIQIDPTTGTSLYAILTSNAALTNQFAATTDVIVSVRVLQQL